MSLRRTSQNPALVEDALRRLRCLGWQGAAMLEYRVRDSDGSFDFIELNPRYWQSLHLDLLAGIDFPRLQMAWFEGQPLPPPPAARAHLRRPLAGRTQPHAGDLALAALRNGSAPAGERRLPAAPPRSANRFGLRLSRRPRALLATGRPDPRRLAAP